MVKAHYMSDVNDSVNDYGTEETRRHGGGVTVGYSTDGGKVAKVRHSSHIELLYDKGFIEWKQFNAGERLCGDAYFAGKMPGLKSNIDFTVYGNGRLNASEARTDAGDRVSVSMAMLDRDEFDVIFDVVIYDKCIKDLRTWKLRRYGMTHLRHGLDKMIKFYRI